MTRAWQTLDRVPTPEGPLELRRRGERSFLITVAGRVLMTSEAHRSEDALATLACDALKGVRAPRVLIGGLGMGYTLRAALDALPASAQVTVVEINPRVVDWCRGPLASLTDGALADPRVTVELGDVAAHIAAARARPYHAIVIDLYEGPHEATQGARDPFYGDEAIAATKRALEPRGVFAVWSDEPDAAFTRRLERARFVVERRPGGRGGRAHVIYLGFAPG